MYYNRTTIGQGQAHKMSTTFKTLTVSIFADYIQQEANPREF